MGRRRRVRPTYRRTSQLPITPLPLEGGGVGLLSRPGKFSLPVLADVDLETLAGQNHYNAEGCAMAGRESEVSLAAIITNQLSEAVNPVMGLPTVQQDECSCLLRSSGGRDRSAGQHCPSDHKRRHARPDLTASFSPEHQMMFVPGSCGKSGEFREIHDP